MAAEEAPTGLMSVVTLNDKHSVTNGNQSNMCFYIESINLNLIKTNRCQFRWRAMCENYHTKSPNKTTRADVGLIFIRRGRRRLDISPTSTPVCEGAD